MIEKIFDRLNKTNFNNYNKLGEVVLKIKSLETETKDLKEHCKNNVNELIKYYGLNGEFKELTNNYSIIISLNFDNGSDKSKKSNKNLYSDFIIKMAENGFKFKNIIEISNIHKNLNLEFEVNS